MTEIAEQLDQLGNALQRAWREDQLRHRGRTVLKRPRRLVVGLLLAAAVVGGGGAIAATVLKSAADEQQGIVAGHLLFAGSQPKCETLTASSFRCTFEKPPLGMTFHDQSGRLLLDRFLGIKTETVDSTHHVDGGCVSISADGRTWNCFLGQSAVDQDIIDPGFLGAYLPDPATG